MRETSHLSDDDALRCPIARWPRFPTRIFLFLLQSVQWELTVQRLPSIAPVEPSATRTRGSSAKPKEVRDRGQSRNKSG